MFGRVRMCAARPGVAKATAPGPAQAYDAAKLFTTHNALPDYVTSHPEHLQTWLKALYLFWDRECQYVAWLNRLEGAFGKLANTTDLFAPLRDLMCMLGPLVAVNKLLCEVLGQQLKACPTNAKLGNIIKQHALRLPVYSPFCAQYGAVRVALHESEDDSSHVHLLVKEYERDPVCEGVPFMVLSKLPTTYIEELPKRLLALIAVASADDANYDSLSEAVDMAVTRSRCVVEESASLATLANMLRIQSRVSGFTDKEVHTLFGARPQKLLFEGKAQWHISAGHCKPVHLFVLETFMLVTRPNASSDAKRQFTTTLWNPSERKKSTGLLAHGVVSGALHAWVINDNGTSVAVNRIGMDSSLVADTMDGCGAPTFCILELGMSSPQVAKQLATAINS